MLKCQVKKSVFCQQRKLLSPGDAAGHLPSTGRLGDPGPCTCGPPPPDLRGRARSIMSLHPTVPRQHCHMALPHGTGGGSQKGAELVVVSSTSCHSHEGAQVALLFLSVLEVSGKAQQPPAVPCVFTCREMAPLGGHQAPLLQWASHRLPL